MEAWMLWILLIIVVVGSLVLVGKLAWGLWIRAIRWLESLD